MRLFLHCIMGLEQQSTGPLDKDCACTPVPELSHFNQVTCAHLYLSSLTLTRLPVHTCIYL